MKMNFKFLFGLLVACGKGGGTPDDGFDRQALLTHLAETVVMPSVRAFSTSAATLETAVRAHCAGGDVEAARSAWRAAASEWQGVEVMRFGPTQTQRDIIYSWPLVSSCAVDQDVMLKQTQPSYDIATRFSTRRGLPALEYLLFHDDLAHTCPISAAPAGWDELPEPDKRAARCAMAVDVATDLAVQARTLADAWDPAVGNQLALLTAPAAGAMKGLNLVSDGMFYVELEVKDIKLAKPIGLAANSCGLAAEPCAADLESTWAGASRDHVVANLRRFQLLFDGGAGVGFDDFLRARGAGALADQMTADLAAAIALVEALPAGMIDDQPQAIAAYDAVKKVTDELKTQFTAVLGLEIPAASASDND